MKIKIHNPIYGVPITYLERYNPNKFNIKNICYSHPKIPKNIPNESCFINGKCLYARLLIRRK